MRRVILLTGAAWLSTCPAPSCARADCVDYADYLHWESLVRLPDSAMDVDVCGTHAYVALKLSSGGGGLKVIDVSDPARPQIVGGLDIGSAIALSIADGYAYVLGEPGFQVVDLADPRNPIPYGRLDEVRGSNVVASGTYAYVGTNWSLIIIDIAVPQNPRVVAEVDVQWGVTGADVSGTYAYVANHMFGLRVIDVADPENPQIISGLQLPGYIGDVVVSGAHAYVAGSELSVVDISDPQDPRFLGAVEVDWAKRAVLHGSHVLLATDFRGFESVDVSDPKRPRVEGRVRTDITSRGIAVSGAYACVVAETSGLHLVAIEHTEGVPPVGQLDMDCPVHLASDANYVYAAVAWEGLKVIDIANPRTPRVVGALDPPNRVNCVTIDGSLAYVATTIPGALLIIDIQDPTCPTILGSLHTGHSWDVALSGTCAYVADSQAGLRVIDVVDPENPFLIATLPTSGFAFAVEVAGPCAYILDEDAGFLIADISDPAHPQIIGDLPTTCSHVPDYPSPLTVSGSFAYLATEVPGRLQVIDAGDPRHPRVVGDLTLMDCMGGVAVSGTTVYLANLGGLQVVDASDPANPRVLGGADTPGQGNSVTVTESYVCVGGASASGLSVFDVQCEEPSGLAVYRSTPGGLRISPCPARARATIRVALPVTEWAVAAISDLNGRRLRRLHEGLLTAGPHEFVWDGCDDAGHGVVAGMYLVRISSSRGSETGRFVIIR